MADVFTKLGILDSELLDVRDVLQPGTETARVMATEWFLKSTGEMVRRDVHVNILVGHLVAPEQAKL